MRSSLRRAAVTLAALACAGLLLSAAPEAQAYEPSGSGPAFGLTLLDTASVPAGTTQLGVPFGGLSGIDRDSATGSYVAISDDRSENAPARYYRLGLPLDGNGFAPQAPVVEEVHTLLTPAGQPFARRALDPEAIRWSATTGTLLWTSEGATATGQPAFVREAAPDGTHARELGLPAGFAPVLTGTILTAGVRNNQALESLTLSPDGSQVITAVENALVQDGPAAGLNAESPARVVIIDRASGNPQAEYIYRVDPIEHAPTAPLDPPINTYSSDRGLSELLALNETDYLAVERSFASGVGFSVKVYWTSVLGADDVRAVPAVDGTEKVMPKRLLFDFASTAQTPDNIEGITWGPRLADGSRSLILVADDNFGFNGSVTKFHLVRVPADLLAVHTPDIDRDGRVTGRDLGELPRAGSAGDLDGNGRTNAADMRLWQRYTMRFSWYRDQPATVDLQLLSFNDFHGNLESPSGRDATLGTAVDPAGTNVGGVEYLAATMNQLRQGSGPSLTVAAGDLIGASPFLSGLFHDEPTIESLESLRLDVSSVGNHEFDEGVTELLRIQNGGCHPVDGCYLPGQPYDGAAFPYLAANVVDRGSGKPIMAPTWVKSIDGVKVGFIGMTLEGTPSVTGQSGIQSVRFLDEVETANRSAHALRARGVRAIVVLLHEGGAQTGTYGQCTGISGPVVAIAQGLSPDIDAVVTGHTHQPYVCSIDDPAGQPRKVTSASAFGRVVTETRLPIDRRTGDVIRSKTEARNHLVTRSTKDADQTAIINKWKALSDPIANRVVGSVTSDITRSQTRDAESDLANLIADAQLFATATPQRGAAQIALMNPGGIRADLTHATSAGGEVSGQITYAEAFAVQPFAGSIVSMDLSGAQIEQILEQQWNNSGTRAPTLILGVSKGLKYAFSASAPVGNKIDPTSITLNGVPLDPATTYRVTANTFLAGGGDGFTTFAQGTNLTGGGDDIAALTEYLAANSPISAPGTDRVNELP